MTRAIDELLGLSPDEFRRAPDVRRPATSGTLPVGESMILWLKTAHADRADEVLERARTYYYQSCA